MPFLIRILVTAFAAIITSYLLPGVHLEGFLQALILAAVLSLLNIFIKPVIILLTIPITFFSFGLFLLVINAFIILLAAKLAPGFLVDSFWWALLFSIVLSLVTSLLDRMNDRINNSRRS